MQESKPHRRDAAHLFRVVFLIGLVSVAASCDRDPEAPLAEDAATAPSAQTPPPVVHDGGAAHMPMTPPEQGREIPAGDPVPRVTLRDEGHSSGAWAFGIETDMTLTMATAPYRPLLGHVHVYVDGVEKLMIAEKQFALRDLAPGRHTIAVALAATDHKNLVHDGALVSDSTEIVVPPPD